jgi:uncharacterized protein YaiL (DUF2058 family)
VLVFFASFAKISAHFAVRQFYLLQAGTSETAEFAKVSRKGRRDCLKSRHDRKAAAERNAEEQPEKPHPRPYPNYFQAEDQGNLKLMVISV